MSVELTTRMQTVQCFGGLRMSAAEFFALPGDGHDYELLDGVVIVTPSPAPQHQRVSLEITLQLGSYLKTHHAGEMFYETDVHLGQGPGGGDLVYRPEIVFYRADRGKMQSRLVGPPDLVVEVVSPPTRLYDLETKRDDYERLGVREYWIVDPERGGFTFFCHDGQKFIEVQPSGDEFASRVVTGFVLNLSDVRQTFAP